MHATVQNTQPIDHVQNRKTVYMYIRVSVLGIHYMSHGECFKDSWRRVESTTTHAIEYCTTSQSNRIQTLVGVWIIIIPRISCCYVIQKTKLYAACIKCTYNVNLFSIQVGLDSIQFKSNTNSEHHSFFPRKRLVCLRTDVVHCILII